MKTNAITLWMLVALFACGCKEKPTVQELRKFAATENFPDDVYLDSVSNQSALIVVAHDDDDCAMSGTIAKLTHSGWTIKQLSLVSHIIPETGENAAPIICTGNELILNDGIYRYGRDTMEFPYLPIPADQFEKQFMKEKVAAALISKINAYNPSVIFTLDNIKGGYGHPEHLFISNLVLDLFHEKKINAERIYQSVYTDHMEIEIVDKWLKARMAKWGFPDASTIANELYGINGMPDPDVQVNIRDHAKTKMKYLMAYPEEVRSNLRKFIPYYEEFDAETYFGIFDREFFRVIQ